MKINKIIITAGIIVVSAFLTYGQQEEVRVVKPYTPTLSGAEKIELLPSLDEEIEFEQPDFSYSLYQKRYDTEYRLTPIVAARMVRMPLKKLYKSHLKAGFGNYMTPYVELNINQLRSRNGTFGFNMRHHSMNGKVRLDNDEKVRGGFNENHLEAYGSRFLDKSRLSYIGGIDYNSVVAYGIDTELNPDTILEREDALVPYFTGFAGITMQSLHADSFHINYSGSLDYYFFSHRFEEMEHGADFDLSLDKSLRSIDLAGELGVAYYGHYPEWDTVLSNHTIIKLNAWISKNAPEWKFVAGFNTSSEIRNGVFTPHFYPKLRFEFNIVKEVIVPYFGVDGYLESNNCRKISDENPYITPGVSVLPTNHKLIAFAGLKGRFSDAVVWNIRGKYSIIDDQYFFVNDTTLDLRNGFTVVYDDLTELNIQGELTIRPDDSWKIFLKGNYYKYNMVREEQAWHLPNFDGSIQARYDMGNKIIVDGGIALIGPRYYENFDPFVDAEKLSATLDINLGVEYRYTRLLSFWVKFNNIAAQRYYLYNQYPSFRFRFMAGFSYVL